MSDFAKIKKILDFVWENPYSSFYRSKYKTIGTKSIKNIKTYQDFEQLPYLTRKEIVESDPYERIFLPASKIEKVTISGGTTDAKYPLVIFKDKTQKEVGQTYYKEMLEKKIKILLMLYPPIRALIMHEAGGTYLNHKILRLVGDMNNLPLSAKIAARLRIDAIQTTPTLLYFFTNHLKKEYDPLKIKVIYLGGEYTSEAKLNYFKKIYKNAFFKFSFGSAEAEVMADRCIYLAKKKQSLFHPLSIFHFENAEDNELVITSLCKSSFPLIRYKTGDVGKIKNEKCKCGKNQVLELLGRKQFDVFKVHGGFIYAEKIGKILTSFDNLIDPINWQLHIYEKEKSGKILPRFILNLILKKKNNQERHKIVISKTISDNLYLSATKTLGNLIEEKIFLPMEIKFIQKLEVQGKQKHIILH